LNTASSQFAAKPEHALELVFDNLVDWIDEAGLFRPRFESNLHGCSLRFVDRHRDAAGEQHDDLIQAGDFSINSISQRMQDSGLGLAIMPPGIGARLLLFAFSGNHSTNIK